MKTISVIPILCLVVFAAIMMPTTSTAEEQMPPPPPVNPKFKQLAQLVGDWSGKSSEKPDEPGIIQYRLTAGGSALVETLFAGTPMEMVSIYTCDGDEIVMTHYCLLGNQPRLKTGVGTAADKFTFNFIDGGNIKSLNDPHMHSLILTFKDQDHVSQEWSCYENGKAKEAHLIELTKIK